MKTMRLEAPWLTFHKKVKKLFERDADIKVGDIYQPDDGADGAFDIEVRNHKKFVALDRTIQKNWQFGGMTLCINLYDEENGSENDGVELFKTIFDGNPIVKDIKEVTDFTGTKIGYVRMKPEILQFPDDDISDYSGNWTGLGQDIARDLFGGAFRGVYFCTADVMEDGDKANE